MPELIIHLRTDPETGRPEVRVGLRSEDDVPPLEHERTHRDLVRRLLHRGGACGDEGPVAVERESRSLLPVAGLG